MNKPGLWRGGVWRLGLAALVCGADQATKAFVLARLETGQVVRAAPWWPDAWALQWHWTLVWNRGISFGLFSQGESFRWALEAVVAVLVVVCGVLVFRVRNRVEAAAWSMVLGAALGNGIDRIRWGAVVDFVLWSYGRWSFPVFNLADSVLTLCAVVLCFRGLPGKRDSCTNGSATLNQHQESAG